MFMKMLSATSVTHDKPYVLAYLGYPAFTASEKVPKTETTKQDRQ